MYYDYILITFIPNFFLLLSDPSSFLFFQNVLSPIGADHDFWLSTEMCLTHQRSYPVFSLPRTHQSSVAPEEWGLLTPYCSGMLEYCVPVTTAVMNCARSGRSSSRRHRCTYVFPNLWLSQPCPALHRVPEPLRGWEGERDVAFVSEQCSGAYSLYLVLLWGCVLAPSTTQRSFSDEIWELHSSTGTGRWI